VILIYLSFFCCVCAGAFANGLVFLTGFASVSYCFYYTLQARRGARGDVRESAGKAGARAHPRPRGGGV
jgi:hypothetical protein